MPYTQTVIDLAETTWNEQVVAGVVLSTDGVDYKEGSNSTVMTMAAPLTAGTIIASEDISALTPDLSSCQRVRLWIKSSVDTLAGDLQLLLDAHANCASPEETLDIPALTAGVWAYVTIDLADPASDGAIISVGLKYTANPQACAIKVDAVYGDALTPEFQRRQIERLGAEAVTQFNALLSRVTEMNQDTGTATGGSNTTLIDTAKSWEVDKWKDGIIEFYDVSGGVYYFSTIISNTATTITCGAFGGAAVPASGDPYGIRMAVRKVGHDITGIGDGRRVVAAAGTRLTLVAATVPAKVVVITAETDNTDIVVVGGVTMVAALATRQGTPLNPGDSVTLAVDDLVDVYLDSLVTGEGVTYTYLN